MVLERLLQAVELAVRGRALVGHFQTRNKGTVCGSIAHADPGSEIALSLAVLNGEVVLRSIGGERVLSADALIAVVGEAIAEDGHPQAQRRLQYDALKEAFNPSPTAL